MRTSSWTVRQLVIASTLLSGISVAADSDTTPFAGTPAAKETALDDSDWAVDLSGTSQSEWQSKLKHEGLQFDRPESWKLPSNATDWSTLSSPDLVDDTAGSSLAEHASVVRSVPQSDANTDSSFQAFYVIIAVIGLIAGGICCLQLSR